MFEEDFQSAFIFPPSGLFSSSRLCSLFLQPVFVPKLPKGNLVGFNKAEADSEEWRDQQGQTEQKPIWTRLDGSFSSSLRMKLLDLFTF